MDNRLIAMVAIVGASIFGGSMYAIGGSFVATDYTSINSSTGITGHVILTVYDEFGNIKHYSQSDNTIVNLGENCIAEYMFNVVTACTGTAVTNPFNTIYLGSGTPTLTTAHGTVTVMATPRDTLEDLAPGITVSTGAPPGDAASDAEVTIETTFTGTARTYTEVALGNDDSPTPDFFAYQNMADATVGSSDSVKVTWVITIN